MNEKSKAANALVQSSLGRILLGLAVLSLTGVTALAQTRPGIAITNDGREVIATKGQSKFTDLQPALARQFPTRHRTEPRAWVLGSGRR